MSFRSVYELFQHIAETHPDKVAYRHKVHGVWNDVSWAEQREVAQRIARALIALGVEVGDRVAILADTRLEWMQCDMGIASCGGVTVGIYHSSLAAECEYVLGHSDAKVLFVEDGLQFEKIREARGRLPELRHVIAIDAPADAEDAIDWEEMLERAGEVEPEEVARRGRKLGPDDLVSLVYTSGTTGQPKGAMISHGNLLVTVDAAQDCLVTKPEYCTLLFLPLAHIFARMIAYLCMSKALSVAFAESMAKIPENIREIRPHFIISVPRVYEKIHEKVLGAAAQAGGVKQRLVEWALDVGPRATKLELAGRPVPLWLGLQRALADRLVFRKIRATLGGRVAWGASGAAPLSPEICVFFIAAGLPIIEGLGMTENTSLSNVNPLNRIKPGTVGPAVRGVEMKIAEDGEVLFRGANVMQGYFKDPEATARTIDVDGWLATGDVGEIDEDGYLKITDRKKDIIVTSGGKNVAPQRIEKIIGASPFISQVVGYGDRRKFMTALITLEPTNVLEWARRAGLGQIQPQDLAGHPAVCKLIQGEVDDRNEQLASYESVKKFRILDSDLSVETGELTATLKIRRRVVYEKFRELLDGMYTD